MLFPFPWHRINFLPKSSKADGPEPVFLFQVWYVPWTGSFILGPSPPVTWLMYTFPHLQPHCLKQAATLLPKPSVPTIHSQDATDLDFTGVIIAASCIYSRTCLVNVWLRPQPPQPVSDRKMRSLFGFTHHYIHTAWHNFQPHRK